MKNHQVLIRFEHLMENNLVSNHFFLAQGIRKTFQITNTVDEAWAAEVVKTTLMHSVKALLCLHRHRTLQHRMLTGTKGFIPSIFTKCLLCVRHWRIWSFLERCERSSSWSCHQMALHSLWSVTAQPSPPCSLLSPKAMPQASLTCTNWCPLFLASYLRGSTTPWLQTLPPPID